ncbi:DUF4148 domain-containing protein [Paraburkholderia dinghuensis]|uniref:DUF4148 domain-containing protein n=1 Tax=Paraburkholderia dinghuensis TaxID=2305225 RepID=A0A3N6NXG6_9BURK|nr:DUF4148 domain-containing protein [Paraburkholderia dinghuensis]RQH05443.1 DUF4148 domain-containing protein [Paraburkholderia dinghuensis]
MKSLVQAVVVAVAIAAPVAVFAQSADQGLTREQVRAQLVEFQQMSRNQVAGSDVAVSAPAAQGDTSYGGVSGTSSMAGHGFVPEAARRGPQAVYFGGA